MCSIISASDLEMGKHLIELNQFRGSFSYSFTTIDKGRPTAQIKDFGEFPLDILETFRNERFIAHVQAPTGGLIKDVDRIHPVQDDINMLWHNGLLTPKGVKYLQDLLKTDEDFDTRLLFNAIEKYGFDILNEIEGLFSCLYLKDGKVYLFRTKHGKLYVDEDMNISSERFEGSKCINADTIYEINFEDKSIKEVGKFKTKRFNFVVKGEL
jgi:hypothetical protein